MALHDRPGRPGVIQVDVRDEDVGDVPKLQTQRVESGLEPLETSNGTGSTSAKPPDSPITAAAWT